MSGNGDMTAEEVLATSMRLRQEVRILLEVVRVNLASDYLSSRVRGILEQCERVEGLL